METFFARAFLLAIVALGPFCVLGQTTSTSPAEKSYWNKLQDGEEVFQDFQTSAFGRARVIVNLVTPDDLKQPGHWKSIEARKNRGKAIHALQEPLLEKLKGPEMELRHRFENQAGFSAEVSPSALEELLKNPQVESVEPVRIIKAHLAQGIPLIGGMTYRSSYAGAGVAIAICDSGVDYWHPQFGHAAFPNSKVIGGYNFGDDNHDPYPQGVAHGTACAGIAAGNLGNYSDYIGGVAPWAKIYALKITAGSDSDASNDKILAAWNWCVSHQYDDPANPILVVSTSYGGKRYRSNCDGSESAFKQATDNLERAGISVVCSAGNDGYCDSTGAPACLSTVISVGAVYDAAFGTLSYCLGSEACAGGTYSDRCTDGFRVSEETGPDVVPAYGNSASFLTLLAPAHSTFTTDISGSAGFSSGDYTANFGGTSASAPYAAGAVAVLQSAARSILGRYLTPSQVRARLTRYGNYVRDPKSGISTPRINLTRSIESFTNIVQLLTPAESETIVKGASTQFSWLQTQPASTWFYFYLTRNGSKYMDCWIPADSASSTNFYTSADPLPAGSYAWWIRPWNSDGYGEWSAATHFTIELCVPQKPSVISPVGAIGNSSTITYAWTADACAVWYDLYIMRNGTLFAEKWFKAADLGSEGNGVSCTVSAHKSGAYSFWVRGWSADGLGAWSGCGNFTVSNQVPGVVTLLNPAEGETLTNLLAPDFAWSESTPAAEWYCIKLDRNGSAFASKWVQGVSPCALTNYLPMGNYSWSVQPWNQEGLGALSRAGHFTVTSRLPRVITQVSPTGTTTGGVLNYAWIGDSNATWYELLVYTNGKTFIDKWYSTNDLAIAGGQIAAPVTQAHGTGNYSWWVRGWGPDGMGPWSSTMYFSVR